jgi:hypothetical protein
MAGKSKQGQQSAMSSVRTEHAPMVSTKVKKAKKTSRGK